MYKCEICGKEYPTLQELEELVTSQKKIENDATNKAYQTFLKLGNEHFKNCSTTN